jgi:endonuclease/exonuclease/phosphatase family metal-dependent hydrolase
MLFGPRWIYGLPLIVLIPFAVYKRRCVWVVAAAVLILLGPIMGCCLPWAILARSDEPLLRVLTLNMHDEYTDSNKLAVLINRIDPDIVALQECRADFQLEWPVGWHVQNDGRRITASRYPLKAIVVNQPNWSRRLALATLIEVPTQSIVFVNLHMSTPRYGLEAVLNQKTFINPSRVPSLEEACRQRRQESEQLREWIDLSLRPVVVAGDFNMPTDSTIYRAFWSKYNNAFSSAGFGLGHTKKTTILGWRYGSRIDHILSGGNWRPCRCWVGPDLGSDHLPLVAELFFRQS